jgi:Protein of unknown function (DUF3421)
VFREGSVIGYGGRVVEVRQSHIPKAIWSSHENQLNKFEVLIGDRRAIRWVRFRGQLNLRQLGATPVEGGREADGTLLYTCRVRYRDGTHPAKIGEHLPAAHLAFSGTEVLIDVRIRCSEQRERL